eukprot:1328349-Amorphochlora_amoeboformis.AAC.1
MRVSRLAEVDLAVVSILSSSLIGNTWMLVAAFSASCSSCLISSASISCIFDSEYDAHADACDNERVRALVSFWLESFVVRCRVRNHGCLDLDEDPNQDPYDLTPRTPKPTNPLK